MLTRHQLINQVAEADRRNVKLRSDWTEEVIEALKALPEGYGQPAPRWTYFVLRKDGSDNYILSEARFHTRCEADYSLKSSTFQGYVFELPE